MNLSNNLKKHFRLFIYYYTNGTLPFLVGDILNIPVDYREELMYEATSVGNIFTIYMNNIKMDENGNIMNNEYAMKRAAQQIRQCIDSNYKVEPPFEEWEVEVS